MQRCTECGTEYADWVSECELCNSPLAAELSADLATDGFGADAGSGSEDPEDRGDEESLEFGSPGRRLAAQLLDSVAWGVVLTVVGLLLERFGPPAYAASLGGFLLVTLTNVTLVSRVGADPGQHVLRLRVVDSDGRWPTWSQALLRAAVLLGPYLVLGLIAGIVGEWNRPTGQLLAWAPLLWIGLSFGSIVNDAQRQGWHDRVARTWVIKH